MNRNIKQGNRGFTVVEALVAIMILSVSVAGMLGVTASSATSARYANNEITANYLLQEAVDSVRNSRDTIAFQMKDTTGGWVTFLDRYGYPSDKCFSDTRGCILKMEDFDATGLASGNNDVILCSVSGCGYLSYDNSDTPVSLFYNYSGYGSPTSFVRTVKMVVTQSNPDELKVTATVDWLNGTSPRSRSLEIYLLDWKK
ncbi:MAG: prepilin-type N-terminal cleavage/methylation domain-containing protein [Candidatus Paceibacterota bacterium]|jgi:type II secretory pathway pseudopilin PulG